MKTQRMILSAGMLLIVVTSVVTAGEPDFRGPLADGIQSEESKWLPPVYGKDSVANSNLRIANHTDGRHASSEATRLTDADIEMIARRLEMNYASMNIRNQPEAAAPRFDSQTVARGQSAFFASCTDCHDAERAMGKSKSLAGWRATVQRMAAKDGADISGSDAESIATFLASRSQTTTSANGESSGDGEAGGFLGGQTSLSATVSTLYRHADFRNSNAMVLENPGFFVDAWVGADWQSGPVHGRVIACTSCHNEKQGISVEIVDATATFDIIHGLLGPGYEVEAEVKAGRFIVPFGAFASMSHPGAYRTLTNPMMYNMGRRVIDPVSIPTATRPPVIPMPYSDEGINFHTKVPLPFDFSSTFDIYAVNGLQQDPIGTPGVAGNSQFFASRRYYDNNGSPALGGRVTVGNQFLRFGGSLMTGEMQNDGAARKWYKLSGVDVTANYEDFLRFYFEYALRRQDAAGGIGMLDTVYGMVTEAEVRLLGNPRIGLLGRYDTLNYRDTIAANLNLQRATWGITVGLPGGGMLIVNHEKWIFPGAMQDDVDIVGMRITGTF